LKRPASYVRIEAMRSETERVLSKVPADFPLVPNPYEVIGERAGLSEGGLIDALKELKERGVVRRIGAILYHRRVSYTHNAMVVWRAPAGAVEEAGRKMASYREVSHCYERETGGYWDYSLYTMIHGRSAAECLAVVDTIAADTGIGDYRVFFSRKELKKTALVVTDE
jgi:DNA-binding Lrp family transcriptional regulator